MLELSKSKFARAIGFTGTDRNNTAKIREFENGRKQIPLYIARLVWLIGEIAAGVAEEPPDLWPSMVDEDGKIIWPDWPGYDYSDTATAEPSEAAV